MAGIIELIDRARAGTAPPFCVLVGTERLLIERAVDALREASIGSGIPGFNDDAFDGKSVSGAEVANVARTLPMMSDKRFVLVRGAEGLSAAAQAELVAYADAPSETTCLVIAGTKLDGRGKLAKLAKKQRVFFEAAPLRGGALHAFVRDEAKRKGHPIAPQTARTLVDSVGHELAALEDALERLSLFAGAGQRIDEAMVETCITRVPSDTIWTLVDAVASRDQQQALGTLASLLAQREPPLRLWMMLARQVRMVAIAREALAGGSSAEEAAREAGAPPFKARALASAAKGFPLPALTAAFETLALVDRALKGSKRPGDLVVQEGVLALCEGRPAVTPRLA